MVFSPLVLEAKQYGLIFPCFDRDVSFLPRSYFGCLNHTDEMWYTVFVVSQRKCSVAVVNAACVSRIEFRPGNTMFTGVCVSHF